MTTRTLEDMQLEDMQYVTGIGPCQDAFATSRPEFVSFLDDHAEQRWPAFVTRARNIAIGSVFAFPLPSNSARVRVLTLYGNPGHSIDNDRIEACLTLSDVIAELLFSVQHDAPPGTLSPALSYVADHRAEVFQAVAMLSVPLTITPDEALDRIRAHSFADERHISAVAGDIIAREAFLADCPTPTTRTS